MGGEFPQKPAIAQIPNGNLPILGPAGQVSAVARKARSKGVVPKFDEHLALRPTVSVPLLNLAREVDRNNPPTVSRKRPGLRGYRQYRWTAFATGRSSVPDVDGPVLGATEKCSALVESRQGPYFQFMAAQEARRWHMCQVSYIPKTYG